MRATIRLGRVFGVPIGMNAGAVFIVLLIGAGLAFGRFPAQHPGRPTASYLLAGAVAAVLFVAGLLAHELAHAVMSRRYGIAVEEIVLWLLGGVAKLRGQPRTPGAEFLIAVVGPAASLAVAVVCGAAAVALRIAGVSGLPVAVAGYLAVANLALAVFNLIPAAPLDGGRVLRAAVWRATGNRTRAGLVASRAGRLFGLTLIILGIGQTLLLGGLSGLWLALLGWFMVHAASGEEQATVLTHRLHGVLVRDAMSEGPLTAPADATVARFIDEVALRHRYSTYPLVDPHGRLTGLVTLNRLRAVPVPERGGTTLGAIACPPADVPLARPDEPLLDLLPRLEGCSDGRAVVVDAAGVVVGLVSPSDISRLVATADLRSDDPYPPRGADLTVSAPTGPAPRR
jgi:Zn-dependent protease/CBS domain-containing protein